MVKTGLIMDALQDAPENYENNIQDLKAKVQAAYNVVNHTPMTYDKPQIGRNDLCPCGSGKKFKNCCMGNGRYDAKLK